MATDRLLIIDDDARLIAMVSDYLGAAGFCCGTPPYRSRRPGRGRPHGVRTPIILDVMLPDSDGFEICRNIRARAQTPVLMLTARGEETDRIVGLEIGADDYLPKPFNPRDFLARIPPDFAARAHSDRSMPKTATLRFGRQADRSPWVAPGADRRRGEGPHQLPVRPPRRLGRKRRACAEPGTIDGPCERRRARSVRPFDRRSYLAHSIGDRGRSQTPPPHPDRTRQRLCLRANARSGWRAMIVFRRRLFWKVYLTLLASLVAVAALMGGLWWLIGDAPRERWGAFHISLADAMVPARDNPPGAIAGAVKRLSDEIGADISVYAADGALAAASWPARSVLAASEGRRKRSRAAPHHAHRSCRRSRRAGPAATAIAARSAGAAFWTIAPSSWPPGASGSPPFPLRLG